MDPAMARFRAGCLARVREFFSARGALEVETPLLSRGISLDCHLDPFAAPFHPGGYPRPGAPDGEPYYLQTSPELHMKRLLAEGYPDIYQITKAFRNGEVGSRHNPEFTVVEWYRLGFSLEALMAEVAELARHIAGPRPVAYLPYRDAFRAATGADPLEEDQLNLAKLARARGFDPPDGADRDTLLEFLMAEAVEPSLPADAFTFIHDYPRSQASLARVHPGDARLARRFELYAGGLELCNGYLELQDPAEHRRRFAEEDAKRRAAGKPRLPPDERFLAALERGLPECAGVALGFDRLVLLAAGGGELARVLSFPWAAA